MARYGEKPREVNRSYYVQTAAARVGDQVRRANQAYQDLRQCLASMPAPGADGANSGGIDSMLKKNLQVAERKAREEHAKLSRLLPVVEQEVGRCEENLKNVRYDEVTLILPSNRTKYTEGILELEHRYKLAASERDSVVHTLDGLRVLVQQCSTGDYGIERTVEEVLSPEPRGRNSVY